MTLLLSSTQSEKRARAPDGPDEDVGTDSGRSFSAIPAASRPRGRGTHGETLCTLRVFVRSPCPSWGVSRDGILPLIPGKGCGQRELQQRNCEMYPCALSLRVSVSPAGCLGGRVWGHSCSCGGRPRLGRGRTSGARHAKKVTKLW